jgi:hypothetical protein
MQLVDARKLRLGYHLEFLQKCKYSSTSQEIAAVSLASPGKAGESFKHCNLVR